MQRGCKKDAFTLIEFLIALVIIGFIVAILVGVFSSPLKQAKLDANAAQIIDGIRQLQDAYKVCTTRPDVTNAGNCPLDGLIGYGIITALPQIPTGSGDGGEDMQSWMMTNSNPTWYGDLTKLDITIALIHVNEETCRAINNKLGHGSVVFDRTDDGNGIDSNPSYPDKGIHCANDWDDFLSGPGLMVIAPLAVDSDL